MRNLNLKIEKCKNKLCRKECYKIIFPSINKIINTYPNILPEKYILELKMFESTLNAIYSDIYGFQILNFQLENNNIPIFEICVDKDKWDKVKKLFYAEFSEILEMLEIISEEGKK